MSYHSHPISPFKSYSTNNILAAAHWAILHHPKILLHQHFPSRSALTNPTLLSCLDFHTILEGGYICVKVQRKGKSLLLTFSFIRKVLLDSYFTPRSDLTKEKALSLSWMFWPRLFYKIVDILFVAILIQINVEGKLIMYIINCVLLTKHKLITRYSPQAK